jgi:hypothetical protein
MRDPGKLVDCHFVIPGNAGIQLARISHRPGYHSDFGEDVERKSDQAGWAV